MLSTRDPLQSKRPTQTEKGLEKDIQSKWTGEKGGVPILISDKIELKKGHKKKHRKTLHNN